MRRIACCVVMLGGCVSVNVSGGAHTAVSGGPSRTTAGNLGFGVFAAREGLGIAEVRYRIDGGPLEDANSTVGITTQVTSVSRGARPGLFAMAGLGWSGGDNPEARSYTAGAGVAWSVLASSDAGLGPALVGSAGIGLVYRSQRQDGLGSGDFLGVEISLTGGANLAAAFLDVAKKR